MQWKWALGKCTCTHAYIHRVIKALRATQRFGSRKIAHLSNRSHHPTSQPEPLHGDGFRDRLVCHFKHRLKHGCFHQPFGDYYRGMDCSRVCTLQVLGKLTVFLIAICVLPLYYVYHREIPTRLSLHQFGPNRPRGIRPAPQGHKIIDLLSEAPQPQPILLDPEVKCQEVGLLA